jgi:general secretion pathway protein N
MHGFSAAVPNGAATRGQSDSSDRQTTGSKRVAWVVLMRALVLLIGLFMIGDVKAQVVTAPLVVEPSGSVSATKPGATPGLTPPATSTAATSTGERVPHANPLWTIPLTSLTATRERPLFSPSRRPPPPVVVAKAPPPPPPPPKPAEPEKPPLVLVGTVLAETGEGIGLFMSLADLKPLRLKVGEDNKGWVLRKVRPRQVVLEKGQQIAALELPRHDLNKAASVPPAAASPAAPPAPAAVLPAGPANRTTEVVVDEVAATSRSPINNPKPMGGFSPPREMGSPVVAPTIIVQPPATPEPQVNPFQKAWLSKNSGL